MRYQLLNRKFQVAISCVLLLFISCNGATGKPELIETKEKIATAPEVAKSNVPEPVNDGSQSPSPERNGYTSCAAFVTDLVQSSNAAALSSFKAVQVRIDEMSPEKITIELYTINDVSEDPAVERMADRTIGWLEFFPAKGKLQDITNDPEEPELLQYNTALLQKADVTKLCSDNATAGKR